MRGKKKKKRKGEKRKETLNQEEEQVRCWSTIILIEGIHSLLTTRY